ILTNPDMLHVGVLPHHDRWADVLHNLAYVVVDEAHVYRGVFGSHVGNVLRRLRRLAHVYGAEPQFLLASATIANPGELARSLLGLDVTVIGADAAPRAERTIALWNPPLLDEELGQRASAIGEASRLYAALVSRGLRTICFAKSRRSAELIHRFASVRQQWGRAGRRGHGLAVLIASEDALDQYFMREPEALLGRRVEAAILDHANPRVLDGHVLSAAFEGPLDDADRETLGDAALERAAVLPELRHTPAGFVWAGKDYPAARISLRSSTPDAVTVVEEETGALLGLVELERSYSTVHDGAVYLHLGEPYLVSTLDLDSRTALVMP